MIIIAHRGYWRKKSEKNTAAAFKKAFSEGFGVETDIRDYNGKLVVSHDIAKKSCLKIRSFFEIYNNSKKKSVLALNIKADGLQLKLKKMLREYKIKNYFVFDMSVPDGLEYLKFGFKIFTRQSEYETIPSFYNKAAGIWLDEFYYHWITKGLILNHLKNGKKICIVSPELHKRNYRKEWQDYKNISNGINSKNLIICTDYPEKAREFFYEKN